jgi:peptide deformylase
MRPNINWVLDDTNPILRQRAMPLEIPINHHDQKLINRMIKYIDASYNDETKILKIRGGIALAGPQVGLAKQVIYIHFNKNGIEHKYLLANPKIVSTSKDYAYLSAGEGCLSVSKDIIGIVKRRNKIMVEAYDLLQQKLTTINAEGILAICMQHEIDHLLGILYYDHFDKTNPNYVEKD